MYYECFLQHGVRVKMTISHLCSKMGLIGFCIFGHYVAVGSTPIYLCCNSTHNNPTILQALFQIHINVSA